MGMDDDRVAGHINEKLSVISELEKLEKEKKDKCEELSKIEERIKYYTDRYFSLISVIELEKGRPENTYYPLVVCFFCNQISYGNMNTQECPHCHK